METIQITNLLTSVGFSSPPAWVRKYDDLSNGEKFRVRTALALTNEKKIICLDEFTSVVDRTVAKVGSAAINKHVRKNSLQFVAVSCHYDILEWLQPNWVLDMLDGTFTWRSVQPRPKVQFQITKCEKTIWRSFVKHHYLSEVLPLSSKTYIGMIENNPAAFVSIMRQPHPIAKNIMRITRIVVAPDYQGIGVGTKFISTIAAAYRSNRQRVTITSSHGGFIKSLNKSSDWAIVNKPKRNAVHQGKYGNNELRRRDKQIRKTASFEYAGKSNSEYAKKLLVA